MAACFFGQAREVFRRPRDLIDGIEHNLGQQAPRIGTGVILLIVNILGDGVRGKLVRGGDHDSANQVLQIEFVLDEILRQRIEQFGIAGRIRDAHVIHGIDQATAHEMSPIPIDDGTGEERIAWLYHPIHQPLAWVLILVDLQARPIQPMRLHDFAGGRIANLPIGPNEDRRLLGGFTTLAAQSAKKSLKLIVIVLAPFLIRMMMALCS